MQENPSNHIRIPHKILRQGLPTPLNLPNQTNSRPCRAVQTTSVFPLFLLLFLFLSRTLRLHNNPTQPRPPPPLLRPLQALQTHTPCPCNLLVNNIRRPSLTPAPSLGREHEDGVECPCIYWEVAAVREVYV